MARAFGHTSVTQRRESRSHIAAAALAAGSFLVVLGTLFYLTRPATPARPMAESSAAVEQPASPASAEPAPQTAAAPVVAAAVEAKAAAVETPADPAAARRDLVQAQLESGEFGPALETAQQASDAGERTELLNQVAQAQMKAGEFAAAAASIRRMPIVEERTEAQREHAGRRALAGGQADFDSLMNLITNNTSGPWSDTGGEGGTMDPFYTGVHVDPQGLLMQQSREEQTGRLRSLGVQARLADLNADMAAPSNLRLVSLTRLENEIRKRLADGKPVAETMKHFAGISQIQYVFLYPEEREIVIGGPAEGWKYNANGLPVGVNSGRPTLQLDDFVTVLRTFSRGGAGTFSCLIVPREEGLKQVKEYVEQSQARGPLNPTAVRGWVAQLQKRLGLQDIEVNGIPLDSRVARVIVEADYRMKLIGVGKLDGGSNIPSYFDLLATTGQAASSSVDALRWWMTVRCDSVLFSPEHNAFEIQGTSVRCLSENELITSEGKRIHTGKSEATNRLFAENFTKHYADLAARDLVFADLQNIFDLSLVAALIEHEGLADRAEWDLGAFARGGEYRPAAFAPAQTVMSVVNHRVYNGKDVVVQVAGGVRGDLVSLVKDPGIVREAARLANFVERGKAPQLPEGRWWWDAAR